MCCENEKITFEGEPEPLLRRGAFKLSWQSGTKARWASGGKSGLLCDEPANEKKKKPGETFDLENAPHPPVPFVLLSLCKSLCEKPIVYLLVFHVSTSHVELAKRKATNQRLFDQIKYSSDSFLD